MTDDKTYSSAKPNDTSAPAPAAAAHHPTDTTNANKAANLYNNPTRHPYRPTIPVAAQNRNKLHKRSKHRQCSCRRCVCLTCFWSILILLLILLVAAIAAAAFYALYRPQRTLFSVTSLKISTFNLTTNPSDDSTRLTTRINVTISAKNANKKITFFYGPISTSVLSNSVNLSSGSFSNFTNSPDSISIIHAAMVLNSQTLDADSVNLLQSDLKRRKGLPMKIVMDTVLGVKLEKIKVKKIGIRVSCEGIHGIVPKGKTVKPTVANTSNAKCKVDLRIKILKWTF